MVKTFVFGGIIAAKYGVHLTAPPSMEIAQRDVETISIAGMNGDLLIDNHRYKPVQITYHCALVPPRGQLRDTVTMFCNALHRTVGYQQLTNDFDPTHYRMAALLDPVSVESLVERGGLFELRFNCKPNRWREDGQYPKRYTVTPTGIANPTAMVAKPLITVYGSGSGELHINGTCVAIHEVGGALILDCETGEAYSQPGEGAPVNRNSDIKATYFPTLIPGDNSIHWTGGITGIDVTARWWDL